MTIGNGSKGASKGSASKGSSQRGGAAAGGSGGASPSVAAFLAQWGISGNAQAIDCLERLSPEVQARVMREFDARADTRDIAGKLCGFANSVARAAGGGGARPPLQAGLRPVGKGVGLG